MSEYMNLDELRNNKYIREKKLDSGISSFNFTSKCFWDAAWSEQTIRARGLFLDSNTGRIVGRSYDKFFAIGERNFTSLESLKENFVYPIRVSRKENGFLGICFPLNGELHFCSKSTDEGNFAQYFKDIFCRTIGVVSQQEFAAYLECNNLSAVFEVIDVEHDPHIVEYHESHVVLLDLIYNDTEFKPVENNTLIHVANIFNLQLANLYQDIYNWGDFKEFLEIAADGINSEGFVLRDTNNFMIKFKNDWYKHWKSIRGVIQQLAAGKKRDEIKNFEEKCGNHNIAMILPTFVGYWIDKYGVAPSVIEFRNWLKESPCLM